MLSNASAWIAKLFVKIPKISLIIKKISGRSLVTRFVGDSAWETAISQDWTKDDIVSFQKKK